MMRTTERWKKRQRSKRHGRITYQHRAWRIYERAKRKEVEIILGQLQEYPKGKVVVYDLGEPSAISILLATLEEVFINGVSRYDSHEAIVLGAAVAFGLVVGLGLGLLA
jgi:hypothetical protein